MLERTFSDEEDGTDDYIAVACPLNHFIPFRNCGWVIMPCAAVVFELDCFLSFRSFL